MKRIIYLLLFIFAVGSADANLIKGDTLSINGIKVIRLDGNHHERGYTYGKLLSKEIYDVYYNHFVLDILGDMRPFYQMMLLSFVSQADVEHKYLTEADAIALGLSESEYADDFDAIWGRPFMGIDLLFSNSIVELASNLGCSALISWGDATADDPILGGELVITRHLDWQDEPALYNNHIIAIHNPSEPDQQRWISIGFAGLIGALSGVNESGVGAFLNMGNVNHYEMGEEYQPVLLSIREALELKDYNGDGISRTDDVWSAINDNIQGGAFIISVVAARSKLDSGIVIECSNDMKVSRSLDEFSNIAGTNLAATNHFRKLNTPVYCGRYRNLQTLLGVDSTMTIEKNWNYLRDAAGIYNNSQVIQYIPATGDFNVSFTDDRKYGWEKEPFAFNFFDLFQTTSIIERSKPFLSLSSVAPNPATSNVNITFSIENSSPVSLDIVSASGKLVYSRDIGYLNAGEHAENILLDMLPNGTYFVKIRTNTNSITNKIMVIR